jgi:hypothetical protein
MKNIDLLKKLMSELSLKQINELHIESMFYEFENFNQTDYLKHYGLGAVTP